MRLPRPFWLPFALAPVLAAGCRNASATDSHRWLSIARDSNYAIAIDTSHLERPDHRQWFVVWYRTDHAQPRLHKGKAFNREVVKSLLRCDDLSFKIARVDLSLGEGRLVAQQLAGANEIAKQSWRNVERGTIEEVVARSACDVARRRFAARAR